MDFILNMLASLGRGITVEANHAPQPSTPRHVEGDDVPMVMTDRGPIYPERPHS
jgi:hypothetical protein